MTETAPETVEPENEPETFPASYVRELRQEAAEHRTKAKEAGEQVGPLREALQDAYLQRACEGILHDPLPWDDSFTDEASGMPDVEKIKAAAEALASEKPHLARVRGDAGQGFRGDESDAVDLAALMRAGL